MYKCYKRGKYYTTKNIANIRMDILFFREKFCEEKSNMERVCTSVRNRYLFYSWEIIPPINREPAEYESDRSSKHNLRETLIILHLLRLPSYRCPARFPIILHRFIHPQKYLEYFHNDDGKSSIQKSLRYALWERREDLF